MSPSDNKWILALTFAALTVLTAFLTVSAAQWWRLRASDGRTIYRLAQREVVFAATFVIFWLVRLNTIVGLVDVRYSYSILQDWLWLLYLALAVAVIRTRP
jgi:hypothetical protein